jgi:competence protein ComEC
MESLTKRLNFGNGIDNCQLFLALSKTINESMSPPRKKLINRLETFYFEVMLVCFSMLVISCQVFTSITLNKLILTLMITIILVLGVAIIYLATIRKFKALTLTVILSISLVVLQGFLSAQKVSSFVNNYGQFISEELVEVKGHKIFKVITVEVVELLGHKDGSIEFIAKLEQGVFAREKIILITPDLPWKVNPKIGDRMQVIASFKSKNKIANDLFSFEQSLYRKKIAAIGFVEQIVNITTTNTSNDSRYNFIESMIKIHGYSDALSLILSMSVGAKDLISSHLKQLFKSTGLSHLLVVSGFHLGFVFYLFSKTLEFVFGKFSWTYYRPYFEIIVNSLSLSGVGVYMWIVNGGLPAIRAFLALGMILCLKLLKIKISNFSLLMLCFIVLSILSPGAIFEAGFQLTYAAVSGLLVANIIWEYLRGGIPNKFLIRLIGSFLFCLFAWIYTAPVILTWFFETFALSPVVNLFFIFPFSICVVAGGMISTLISYSGIFFSEKIMLINIEIVEHLYNLLIAMTENLVGSPSLFLHGQLALVFFVVIIVLSFITAGWLVLNSCKQGHAV